MRVFTRIALFMASHLPRGYWRVLRFAAMRDPALWDIALPLRLIPTGKIRADLRESVYVPIYRNGHYSHQMGEDLICMQLLRPGDIVIDVGANIGYTAILFSSIVGPTGKVIALEPSPRCFRLLERAVSDIPNVECLNTAASSFNGEVSFYESDALDRSSIEDIPGIKPFSVNTVTLDSLVSKLGFPAFVKIDVEGHESSVIGGMSAILSCDNPPIILFEALSSQALEDNLASLNKHAQAPYLFFRIKPEGALGSIDETGTNNYLALPQWAGNRVQEVGVGMGNA